MIKYIGSKRLLVSAIVDLVKKMPEVKSTLDLFSGTSRVGLALKQEGYQVLANDHNAYAAAIARCYIAADGSAVEKRARGIIDTLNAIPGRAGYFTETFCVKSRFFQPKNGERIDAIRETIEKMNLKPIMKAVILVSLMEAADRVDSTTGIQMAYLKNWAPRSNNDLQLRMPDLVSLPSKHGPGLAFESDAMDLLKSPLVKDVDLAYVDPPYNQHKYLGNYHIWESLVRWDKPEVYGVACKRVDCKTRGSDFNSKPKFESAFHSLIQAIPAKRLIVSYSSDGFLSYDTVINILGKKGSVNVHVFDNKRYVGAQIGIHNAQGRIVGAVGELRNSEYLFTVDAR